MMEEYVRELMKMGKRVDKRKLDELRPIEFEVGLIPKAEGSARVRLGTTDVIVGVKLDVGEPFPDTPDKGILITNAEFSPIASPEFEPGPPGEDAIELASRIMIEGRHSRDRPASGSSAERMSHSCRASSFNLKSMKLPAGTIPPG